MKAPRRFKDYLKGQLKDEEFRKGFEEEGVHINSGDKGVLRFGSVPARGFGRERPLCGCNRT